MRVGILQLKSVIGDVSANLQKLRDAHDRALRDQPDFLLTTEMALTGYLLGDVLRTPAIFTQVEAALADIALWTQVPMVVGCPTRNDGPGRPAFNTAILITPEGEFPARYHKRLLPYYDVFDDTRHFEHGPQRVVWSIADHAVEVSICEDLYHPPRATGQWMHTIMWRDLFPPGPSEGLLINLSASPFEVGKHDAKRAELSDISRVLGRPIAYCNLVGCQDDVLFDGGSLVFDAQGELVAELPRFEEAVQVVDLGAERVHPEKLDAVDELHRALVMGTREFLAQSGIAHAWVGLSGGIDSALTAALAVEALGPNHVTGVLMPGPYSSQHSVDDARQLAENLGIAHPVLPIHDGYAALSRGLASQIGDDISLAHENLQARLRGVTLMALSNAHGGALLSTSNKSEFAVGYATLYGDMCGALAPIADIYKTDVYRLARWINRHGEVIPASTLNKPPSAELRPDQRDSDSLPEYDALDHVLKQLLEQDKAASECDTDLSPDTVADIARRVASSQFKRYQSAPMLKVSARCIAMRSRRYPITGRVTL